MEDESKALHHNSDSCVCFESDCSKCKHVLLCILHLAERQEHVILSLSLCTLNMLVFIFDLGKSRGTSRWMSCFKGEQHVNRGEMKAGVALKISAQWMPVNECHSPRCETFKSSSLPADLVHTLSSWRVTVSTAFNTESHRGLWWKDGWNSRPGPQC